LPACFSTLRRISCIPIVCPSRPSITALEIDSGRTDASVPVCFEHTSIQSDAFSNELLCASSCLELVKCDHTGDPKLVSHTSTAFATLFFGEYQTGVRSQTN
jgi:hypothetical protein